MGQKTNSNCLRPYNTPYVGSPYWDQTQFNFISKNCIRLIEACCKNTNIYPDKTMIKISHNNIIIETNFLRLYSDQKKKRNSRRYNENKQTKERHHWKILLRRLYLCQNLILEFTGFKYITLKYKKIHAYSRIIPKQIRQKTTFYTKNYNKTRFSYARIGIQLFYLVIKGYANEKCLTNFLRNNIRTRSRRKKHSDFLRFIKQSFDALNSLKIINGLRIQIKGRFGHKPKGRSRIWKYQLGTMPFNTFNAPIHSHYRQAQTKLGSVGIKVWIYKNKYATKKNKI